MQEFQGEYSLAKPFETVCLYKCVCCMCIKIMNVLTALCVGYARIASESDKNHPPIRWVLPTGLSARALSGVFKLDWINRFATICGNVKSLVEIVPINYSYALFNL